MKTHRPRFHLDHAIRSSADAKAVYDYIYRWPTEKFGPYGSHTNRDQWFLDAAKKHLPIKPGEPPPRILDASCGRGHLARSLKAMGYDVEGTEISEYLIREEFPKTMQGIPTHLLAYDELDQLPEKSFDAVCSNDVLEHLPSQKAIERAFANFARLSRGYVFFCAGAGRHACKYPRSLKMSMPQWNLHLFVPDRLFWSRTANHFFKQVEFTVERHSAHYIGAVK